LERSAKLAKKVTGFNKEYDKKFAEIVTKAKKGNIGKDEKITPRLTE
jgi:hypothetical protein